jgi:hypothetical protein
VLPAPTAADDALGAGKWAIGPAVGFVARSYKLLWGLFNHDLFPFAGDGDREDVNLSILQPIVNYSLLDKWSALIVTDQSRVDRRAEVRLNRR